jgi:hypothetical protein
MRLVLTSALELRPRVVSSVAASVRGFAEAAARTAALKTT